MTSPFDENLKKKVNDLLNAHYTFDGARFQDRTKNFVDLIASMKNETMENKKLVVYEALNYLSEEQVESMIKKYRDSVKDANPYVAENSVCGNFKNFIKKHLSEKEKQETDKSQAISDSVSPSEIEKMFAAQEVEKKNINKCKPVKRTSKLAKEDEEKLCGKIGYYISVRGDGNCYYRALAVNLLLSLCLEKKEDLFFNAAYDIVAHPVIDFPEDNFIYPVYEYAQYRTVDSINKAISEVFNNNVMGLKLLALHVLAQAYYFSFSQISSFMADLNLFKESSVALAAMLRQIMALKAYREQDAFSHQCTLAASSGYALDKNQTNPQAGTLFKSFKELGTALKVQETKKQIMNALLAIGTDSLEQVYSLQLEYLKYGTINAGDLFTLAYKNDNSDVNYVFRKQNHFYMLASRDFQKKHKSFLNASRLKYDETYIKKLITEFYPIGDIEHLQKKIQQDRETKYGQEPHEENKESKESKEIKNDSSFSNDGSSTTSPILNDFGFDTDLTNTKFGLQQHSLEAQKKDLAEYKKLRDNRAANLTIAAKDKEIEELSKKISFHQKALFFSGVVNLAQIIFILFVLFK